MPGTNWWVHRYVSGGNATYFVNHVATMINEDMRKPNNSVGYSTIASAEAGLATMGIENGQTWYIHREDHPDPKTYCIDHSSSNSSYQKTCPGAVPGYASIVDLCNGLKLSTFHNNPAACP